MLKSQTRQGTAVWKQIERSIAGWIMAGEMVPGDRLPSEANLAERFGVNKHTVRRAIAELVTQNILRVENGKGAFVDAGALSYAIRPETRFWENIVREGRVPSVDYLGSDVVPANVRVARGLSLDVGTSVIYMDTIGRADGKPILLGRHFFDANRFPTISTIWKEKGSIRAALKAMGIEDKRKTVVIAAHVPTPEEAELLELPWPEPVIEVETVYCDQHGAPVDFGVSRYASNRVRLDVL